jgi:hypothetical protein
MVVSGLPHTAVAILLGKESFGTHWIRGLMGCRADLDAMDKRKNSFPCWELNPDSLIIQPVA